MARCAYCLYPEGSHAATCTRDKPEGSDARRSWRQGADDARLGRSKDADRASKDKFYNLGWIVGRIAPSA